MRRYHAIRSRGMRAPSALPSEMWKSGVRWPTASSASSASSAGPRYQR